ncbi:general transcription factor II-I repeat domain-containing protein 2B-like [Schistocerca piceifrons]|uniref:general transcription factor II-I repeat domain-containing protein 2B-like n=1 Tax=Schistocerca piceifrons TaxID=274613 RepID=UPI001F5F9283|nr:general transcription factor II-I repeat domain-containing protein 2B-like [Schistocerca piceifrons]
MEEEQMRFVGLVRKQATAYGRIIVQHPLHFAPRSTLCKGSKTGARHASGYLRSHRLTHRQFHTYLAEIGEEYSDIPYQSEIRWLSRGNVLKRFFEMRIRINQFLKDKGRYDHKLEDPECVADLAFLVYITRHMNALNTSLVGENQLICEKAQAFTCKLELWERQLTPENAVHFPALSTVREQNCKEYVSVLSAINLR